MQTGIFGVCVFCWAANSNSTSMISIAIFFSLNHFLSFTHTHFTFHEKLRSYILRSLWLVEMNIQQSKIKSDHNYHFVGTCTKALDLYDSVYGVLAEPLKMSQPNMCDERFCFCIFVFSTLSLSQNRNLITK